jgi:hypothetical protein
MGKTPTNAFHAGGHGAYGAAIRAEYESQRQELEKRLRQADSEQERSRLAEELRELKEHFCSKNGHWGSRLF